MEGRALSRPISFLGRHSGRPSKLPVRPLRPQLIQDWLESRVRFQQSGSHELPELAACLAQFLARGLHRRVGHRFLVGRTKTGSFFVGQVRPARPAFVLKLAKRPIRPIGSLSRERGCELRHADEGGNEEVNQFRFHWLINVTRRRGEVARAGQKRSLVISFRQA